MPIIAFANPKGGTGKSTSALLLSLELARRGAKVALVDCDPNQVTHGWAEGRDPASNQSPPFHSIANPGEQRLIDTLEDATQRYPFVIVDLEGTASLMMSRTMSRADMTIIPMQPSPVDARQAARAVQLIRAEEKMLRRAIPMRILLTRNNPAIKTRDERAIVKELTGAGVPLLSAAINERAAYRAVFAFQKTLEELTDADCSGLERARQNAALYATAVLRALRDEGRLPTKGAQTSNAAPTKVA